MYQIFLEHPVGSIFGVEILNLEGGKSFLFLLCLLIELLFTQAVNSATKNIVSFFHTTALRIFLAYWRLSEKLVRNSICQPRDTDRENDDYETITRDQNAWLLEFETYTLRGDEKTNRVIQRRAVILYELSYVETLLRSL